MTAIVTPKAPYDPTQDWWEDRDARKGADS